ncbi:MAG: thiamine pyrophosphate-dependent enzyme [Oscillospiraceae bacterium]
MKLTAPESMINPGISICPGCSHGIAERLIAEAVEAVGMREKFIPTVDVACGAWAMDAWDFDTVMCAHGRPVAVAAGVKRARKDALVAAYLGDGAAYSIGTAETVHSALRNENIVVVVINNGVYGMTGGQMAPTTLPGQKTVSCPAGRDVKKQGGLFDISHVLSGMDVAYVARASLDSPANIVKAGQYIKKAFEKQLRGEGFCLVELLGICPTNWGLAPAVACERLRNETHKYYALGEFTDRKGE